MTPPRLLITLSINFGIRYLVRTGLLAKIAHFATPVIAMTWEDAELRAELEQIGAEVHLMPEPRYGRYYTRVRREADTWHKWLQLRSPSTSIDERRALIDLPLRAQVIRRARTANHLLKLTLPGAVERMLATERILLERDSNIAEFDHFLLKLRPDAAMSITPFHRQEELLLRAAERQRVPLCAAMHSFDNLTTRGWIPITFNLYLLWNRYNEAELRRAYPNAVKSRVIITGPPQFDFYGDKSYIWEEAEWRRRLKLPQGRPVILYGGGTKAIVPHEPQFLAQIDDAITVRAIPDQPIILFRRHPLDPIDRWMSVLRHAQNVVRDEPWATAETLKFANMHAGDIAKQVSTLYHSQIHISVSSTMTLDGAFFDRPQIGPAYDDAPNKKYDRICRELYQREHYLPITNSGGIEIVKNREEMIEAFRQAHFLSKKQEVARAHMLRDMCSYTDAQCTNRIARSIFHFLQAQSSYQKRFDSNTLSFES